MTIQATTDETVRQTHGRAGLYVALSLFGFLLIAIGLATDFVLHANDSSLAANEGVFSIKNPGHLLLAIGLVVVAVGLGRAASIMISNASGDSGILRIARVSLGIGVVALVVALGYIVAGPGFGHEHGTVLSADSSVFDGVDRSRLPEEEALALATLSWSRPGSLSDDADHGHDGADSEPDDLTAKEEETLDSQIAIATAARTRFDTVAEAEALGYVQGSGVNDGSGAHWIKWSLVDKPFDIENPSMLLFDELKRGEPMGLIAYSYWVPSDHTPEGFAGETDEWHRHVGMCFEGGWLKDDNIPDRRSCAGDWINGSDLWMLHAWVVPGLENEYGQFANVNPLLCEHACGLEN